MVWHVMEEMMSLDEISRVSGNSSLTLREAYQLIYPHRERLIPVGLPAELMRRSRDMSSFLALQLGRTPENSYHEGGRKTDLPEDLEIDDADSQENEDETSEEDAMQELCDKFWIELGYDKDALEICQSMAGDFMTTAYKTVILLDEPLLSLYSRRVTSRESIAR